MLTPVAPASAGQQSAGALPRPLEPLDRSGIARSMNSRNAEGLMRAGLSGNDS